MVVGIHMGIYGRAIVDFTEVTFEQRLEGGKGVDCVSTIERIQVVDEAKRK